MRSKDFLKDQIPKTWIRSKAKFTKNFSEELSLTIQEVWEFLDTELEKNYQVEYVDISWRNIKIKIEDEEKFIFRIVNCVFENNSTDEKFGNTRIDLTFTELSKKPRYAVVWKFNILERENIKIQTLKQIVIWLEEIYE